MNTLKLFKGWVATCKIKLSFEPCEKLKKNLDITKPKFDEKNLKYIVFDEKHLKYIVFDEMMNQFCQKTDKYIYQNEICNSNKMIVLGGVGR